MKGIITLLGVVLLAFGAVMGACDGDGDAELTLEEYFQRIEELNDDYDARAEAAGDFWEDLTGAESEEERIEVIRYWLDVQVDLIEGFFDGMVALTALNPPDEVEDEHAEKVDATRAAFDLFRDRIDELEELEGAEFLAGVSELFEGEDLAEAEERGDEACFALQAIADENEIDIDLDCAAEPEWP